MEYSVIILAAGQGKRMYSALPKVLHKIAGKPILAHMISAAKAIAKDNVYVVYGHGGEQVREQLQAEKVHWVLQEELLGTGHAVLQVLPLIPDDHQILTLVGDCPLIKQQTLQNVLKQTCNNSIGVVTADFPNPHGLGRIIRDAENNVTNIVEERDATAEQQKICEINSGIITAPAKLLKEWLPQLKNHNAQEEYYLTDIIAMAAANQHPIHAVKAQKHYEVHGINTRKQLAELERFYQLEQAENFMLQGVTLADPNRFDVRGDVEIGQDTEVDINVIFSGKVRVGKNCRIGPNCELKDVSIADNVEIKANCILDDAIIGNACVIGPYARVRPGTELADEVKLGNFVEIKKTRIAEKSKVPHLSYIGDAIIGREVNVGAGTITCNYDGVNKRQTIIEDGAFIGSDTQLIAPVTIGKNAYIGSGATISKDAPADKLTICKKQQVVVEDWQPPKK